MLKLKDCNTLFISAGAVCKSSNTYLGISQDGAPLEINVSGYTVYPDWMANRFYGEHLHDSYLDNVMFVEDIDRAYFLDRKINNRHNSQIEP